MTLSQRIIELIQAVGADIKALLTGKQDALVAGQNIKTINGQSLLGLGDLSISSGGSGSMPDVLDLTTVDEPASPQSGHLSVYAKSLGGRAMLAQKGASGISTVYQPHLGRNYCQVITSNGGGSALGYGCTVRSSTASSWTPKANLGVGTVYKTSATVKAVYIWTDVWSFYRAAAGSSGGFHFFARVGFPDASYDGTAASTGSRIFVGMTAAYAARYLTDADAVLVGEQGVGFRRVHNFDGVQHTNWHFSTCNNTTETLADTGLAFVAGHQYTFSIFSPAGADRVTWEVENVTTGDRATGVATDTLPALMTGMRPVAVLGTIDAVSRSMWFQSMYAEADF
ncbi:MAG: hypothetical protein LWW76_02590 [Burkholderiales bacterium]|nr:hypothetical protein [Burkholderiales bacterium]